MKTNKRFSVVIWSILLSLAVISSTYAASTIGTNMSTTGTFTLTTGSATAVQIQNAAGTVTTFIVDTTNKRVGVGGTPSTTFEVQGTASASYLFSTNTLQVGAISSAAYSRFGGGTTTAAFLSTTDDLLITGKFEVDGAAEFDALVSFTGGASVSTDFEVTGNRRFGVNAGVVTNTSFEVGGTASISGIASVSGNFAAGMANTGTSSFEFTNNSATLGGCIVIKDNDGAGYTYLRVSNGSGTFSSVSCR